MSESVTEGNSNVNLETYLKNVILEDRDKVCNYVELSAREILPITRRLFEERVSLAYDFKISQIVEKERHLIIYGEASSGKTSTLKWLRTVYAREYILKREEFVPIYIELSSYVKGSFYNYLKAQVTKKGISETDFKKLIEGKALLLLDGLDLLTPSEKFSPFDEISDFISEYETCRYVIASRPEPSDSLKSTFALSELEKLTDEKVRLFIEKNVSNKRQVKLLKARILEETQSKPILKNPLLLCLWIKLSTAHMGRRGKQEDIQHFTSCDSIPSSRAEIYQAFVSELFKDYRKREEFFRSQNQLPPKMCFERTDSETITYERIDSQKQSTERTGSQELSKEKTNSQELSTERIDSQDLSTERKDAQGLIKDRINPQEPSKGRIDPQELNTETVEIEDFLMNLAFKLQCRNKISCKYSCALEVAEAYIKSRRSGGTTEYSRSDRVRAKKFLQACLRLGLLIRTRSEVRFGIDRAFQEYFAALKLKTYFESGMDTSKAFINPRWENVIMLTSDLLESGEELVNSIVSSENLYLASKCALRASPETKGKLCTLLARKLDSRYTVEKVRAIQSLGRLGACGIKANIGALKDKDIRVKRETTKVLGETRSEMALVPLEAAIGDEDYSVRIEAVKSLGLIGSERAIELLRDTFKDNNRAVRLEAADALMQIGSEKALDVLISALGANDDFVRIGAVGALGRTNSRQVAEALIKAFQEEDKLVRLGAAEALGRMRSEKAVESFVDALEDKDEFVRWIATKALGEIKSDKTSGTFIDMLGDKSRFVRREAAKGLGIVGSEKTLDPLVSALSDEDEFVRKTAVESLGGIKSEKAAKTLINKLHDDSHLVRLEAAKALGMIKVRKAIAPLLFALGDENRFVRKEAANALGQLESEKVLEPLIRIFKSEDPLTRQGAVRALGQINLDGVPDCISDRIFDFTDNALKDKDKFVRKETAKALQSLSESRRERAFESLINALDNEDDEVRRLAAESLGLFDCEKAIPPLVSALKSRDATVRRFAANTLGRIRSKEALQPLTDILVFDNSGSVREEAAKALGKIKSRRAIEPLIDALMDQHNEGRSGAAEALGRIKAEKAVDHLISALMDTDDFTRLAAAKALGRIKPKKAIEPLINSLYDWNRFVKAEAAGALKKICTEENRQCLQALLDSENEFTANLAFEILEGIEMEEILKTGLFLEWE
ncbi:HEAT repeat domain-containing protein [Methanosarcina sp.]|uniref:HEAT repeat domain-containing protein n=1 Tax=Methanosarcina sp. TaxID=2213 RepID=UPI002988683B|nr:HEAT repeat domain-containing protein [Methanosarcina sp.]MDW5548712.1 HEAT repeat domain-containing protein [Methanosarcina sp.]MDW5553823.1 HEAT repeat domain-containing protein [Methanosarcina sp.]MDW5558851.1 HEAT repeat domain-containing protein [Methanosarcina sp.]